MDIVGKKMVVIGGAGLIGSHTVDRLVKEDVKEITDIIKETKRLSVQDSFLSNKSKIIFLFSLWKKQIE